MASILVVDDSSFTRFVIKTYLERLGHTVVGEASNHKNTIKLYKAHCPDIVTMDLYLEEDQSGLSVLADVIKIDSQARVIMCSSQSDSSTVIQAVQLGAKGYLVKPVDSQNLKSAIDKALEASSSSKNKQLIYQEVES